MKLTDEEKKFLEEVTARCDAATKGPWVLGGFWDDQVGSMAGEEVEIVCADAAKPNGQFIAAAREDIPRLASIIRRLSEPDQPESIHLRHPCPWAFQNKCGVLCDGLDNTCKTRARLEREAGQKEDPNVNV